MIAQIKNFSDKDTVDVLDYVSRLKPPKEMLGRRAGKTRTSIEPRRRFSRARSLNSPTRKSQMINKRAAGGCRFAFYACRHGVDRRSPISRRSGGSSLKAPNYPAETFPDGVRIEFHFTGVKNGCHVRPSDRKWTKRKRSTACRK